MFTYREMKLAIYCFEVAMGAFLIVVGIIIMKDAATAPAPIVYMIPSMASIFVGLFLLLFGFDTYLLRDDPDIWR